MDCTTCREAISAALDGESAPDERAAVDVHLASCAGCRAWSLDASRLHRQVRLRPAEPVPDLAPAILSRAHPPNAGRWEWIRTALAVVALTELALSVPALFGDDAGASVHVARHVGSLSAALAVGLLYAAWKPVRAYGLLPIALALAGCMLVTTAIDLVNGRVDAVGEAHHVLDLVAVGLLWALAGWPVPHRRGRPAVRTLQDDPVSTHYQAPGWFTRNVFNRGVAGLTKLGISVMGSRVLAVRGRTSGEWRTTPVNLLELDGRQYLVAPRGVTQWVKNLRAAGGGELHLGRKVQPFLATEIGGADAVPILRQYLRRWKWEVGQFFAGTGPDSSDEQLLAIVGDHPVFELRGT